MAKSKAAGNGMSKMDGVRQSLQALGKDAMPVAIQEHLKKTFSIDMTPNTISNYKSLIQNSGKKRGRPKKAATAPSSRQPRSKPAATNGAISIDDIRTIRELASRIGAQQLAQLAEVLA